MKWVRLCAATLLVGGCSALPEDPDGTLKRVRASRTLAVGVAENGSMAAATGRRLVSRLAAETGATPRIEAGPLEPLLVKLEHDQLDLVIAPFDRATPWADRLALTPPLATEGSGDRRIELRAAARNGENRWIMLVERSARQVSPKAARR